MTQFLGLLILICLVATYEASYESSKFRLMMSLALTLVFAALMMLSYWGWHP